MGNTLYFIVEMFDNTIDKKSHYINNDGVEMVDLCDTIFSTQQSTVNCSFYKVTRDMKMRPDLMSISTYGEDIYTEMIMKYSEISNPFAIDEGDIIAVPLLNGIYDEIKDTMLVSPEAGHTYDLVKNYHKYIDKSKWNDFNGTKEPEAIGSKQNETNTPQIEPNMANNGKSGINIINGRLYFGPNISVKATDVEDVDGNNDIQNNLVDCAKNGVTIGQFINATIKNNLKR